MSRGLPVMAKLRSFVFVGILLLVVQSPFLGVFAEEPVVADQLIRASSEAFESPVSLPYKIFGSDRLADAVSRYLPARETTADTRKISFIVVGEVQNPGEYMLSTPVNLLSAVLVAGGPTPDGSMRRIQVYYDDSLLGEFDLYGFLNEGRIVDDFFFNGGERVVVLPRQSCIHISGNVKSSAVFELKLDEMKLSRLFNYAGGFVSEGENRIDVIRSSDGKRYLAFSTFSSSLENVKDFVLKDGDCVNVFSKTQQKRSAGKIIVQYPNGEKRFLVLGKDMRISDLLNEIQPMHENIECDYAELLREGRSDKKYQVIGISITRLKKMLAAGDASQDLVLVAGDRLMLFDREFFNKKPVVGIELKGQTPYFTEFHAGMKLSDLLYAIPVDLPLRPAHAVIVRRNLRGSKLEMVSMTVDPAAARLGNRRYDIELQPFDLLVVQP